MQQTSRRVFNASSLRFRWTLWMFLALSATLMMPPVLAVQSDVSQPIPVAVTGYAAPSGGNYTRANFGMGIPSLNDAGQLAFRASVSGGSEGFFAGTPGSVQVVAMQGSAAPGGGHFSAFYSDTPALNNAGQIVFNANLSTGGFGLFQGSPGALQSSFLAGETTPSGGTYGSLSHNAQNLNSAGQLVFTSNINNGPANRGMFRAASGTAQTIVLEGQAAPSGGNFATFDTFPLLNDAGQVAFLSGLNNSPSTSGVFVGTPGNVQAVALRGTSAPRGGVFNIATLLQLNSAGQVAFLSTTNESGVGLKQGMFIGTPDSVQAIVLSGDQIPSGGSLTFESVSGFALNSAGQVAFQSPIYNGTAASGVFVGTPDSLGTVALEGTMAPGGGTFRRFGNPSLNNLGQIAFLADLKGTGITTSNDKALYAGLPGNLVKVVRKGDVVDVDPGVGVNLRTVLDISFVGSGSGENGRITGFNESGLLVYRLDVGEVGVFASQLTPIPEPSTLVLGGWALLSFTGWRLRRRRVSA